MMNARFANNSTMTIQDIRVNNGVLEIDFTEDKTAEQIETLMSDRSTMGKVELLDEAGQPYCYYSNFTEFSGVYQKGTVKRGYSVQPKADIEIRMNEVQTTANDALATVQQIQTSAKDLQEDIKQATNAATEATQAATELTTTTKSSVQVSKLYAQTLPDDKALTVKDIYDTWQQLVDAKYVAEEVGFKFTHENILYKTRQPKSAFQIQYVPGAGTESLYEVIDETHAGTKEDPIPYAGNMELTKGKFYSQDGVVYECIRDSGTPLYNALKDLVGNYVNVAQ